MRRGFPQMSPWRGDSETPRHTHDTLVGLHFPPSLGVLPEELGEVTGKEDLGFLNESVAPLIQISGGKWKQN